ncbi:MAG: cytidine deaminase [Promicromonosporaceae bacterium]|jgi:cytidine deaminase|nr:cytidine deaminase [Promicromonosporaceae bacterium]
MTSIDWEALRDAARQVMGRAYVPYSKFPVGAAALVDDGRIVVGCNVENAGYGVTLCAECGLISSLVAGAPADAPRRPRLLAFTCTDARGAVIMPCGRCRQLLWEHGGPDLQIETPEGILPMSAVLPQAFGPEDLATVAQFEQESAK